MVNLVKDETDKVIPSASMPRKFVFFTNATPGQLFLCRDKEYVLTAGIPLSVYCTGQPFILPGGITLYARATAENITLDCREVLTDNPIESLMMEGVVF